MSKILPVLPYPNKLVLTGGVVPISAIKTGAEVSGPFELDKRCPDEGYILSISANGTKISAAGDAGAFYAKQTLLQLASSGLNEIPCCLIEDAPRFKHRGFMLDVARHMLPVSDIKKLIDAMALMKMNIFHWHLTDDQGWRVPVDKYPRLIEVGSVRQGSYFGEQKDDSPYGGFYTRDELRDIVNYCAERHISVVPELDIPGHTSCAIASYPELGCSGDQISVRIKQGISKDILCVGKDEVMNFVYDVLDEFCAIFPGPYFHIGGDEAPKKRWKICPDCQKRIKEEGLDNEQQLQGWFNKQVAAFLAERGKKTIVWNEGLYSGQMGSEVIGQRWFDPGRFALRFANKGGNIIMSDNAYCYLDYLYGRLPLKKIYSYNPMKFGLSRKGKANVLGVESPLWTEYVLDLDRASYMAFPRLCATAEIGWTKPSAGHKKPRSYNDFFSRLSCLIPQLRALGVVPAEPDRWDGKGLSNKKTFPRIPRRGCEPEE